jgi:phage terminase large subunit-like protein
MTLFPGIFSKRAISEFGIDLGKEIIYSGGGGRIESVTSSPRALEGGRATFVVMNETQHWLRGNDGDRMAEVIARNLAKIRGGAARSLAITNAHNPGENSVAERDYEAWCAVRDKRTRSTGFYYDSVEADPRTDLSDRDSLKAGLAEAAGDANWLDLDRLVETIYDPTTPPSVARRFYLNQIAETEDSWIAPREWSGCEAQSDRLAEGDLVTLGFDGSVRDDATALVACRVSDGLLELLGCWEKPEGPAGEHWQVDREAVDAAVWRAFDTFDVCGMYADPAQWQDYLDRWTNEFGDQARVKATQQRPFEFWCNRVTIVVHALERFFDAVLAHELKHSGNPTLTRHVLNARRRDGRVGITIAKEHPGSPRKIDAAMAAVLAYEARADAVALGISAEPELLGGFTFY